MRALIQVLARAMTTSIARRRPRGWARDLLDRLQEGKKRVSMVAELRGRINTAGHYVRPALYLNKS